MSGTRASAVEKEISTKTMTGKSKMIALLFLLFALSGLAVSLFFLIVHISSSSSLDNWTLPLLGGIDDDDLVYNNDDDSS